MARQPKSFHELIGQNRAAQHLRRLITGALKRGVPCPSFLVAGPSGNGKTSLARATAAEYGTKLHTFLAGGDAHPRDICEALLGLEFGDFFFVDEAHSLGRDAQQVLYTALDERRVPGTDERRLDRRQLKNIAEFTLILATNEPGSLKHALKNRLTQVDLEPYRENELRAISIRIATQNGIELTPQAATHLARCGLGSPREIARRVEALRLYWPEETSIQQEHVRFLLRSEGVDECGLRSPQRQYLIALANAPEGTCSLERLAIKLGCDIAYVRREVEPLLIDLGSVATCSKYGRVITAKGRTVVAAVAAFSDDAPAEGESC